MLKAASNKTKKIISAAVAAAMVAAAVPAVALVSAATDTNIGIEAAYAETTVEKLARMADSAASQTPYAASLANGATGRTLVLDRNKDFSEYANPWNLYSDGTDDQGNFSADSGKKLSEVVKSCSGYAKAGGPNTGIVRWAFVGGKIANDNDGWGDYPVKGYGTFYLDCDGVYDPNDSGAFSSWEFGRPCVVTSDYGAVELSMFASTIVIGKHVTELATNSMNDGRDFQTLDFETPSSLTKINPETFLLSKFKKVNLPASLTKIPDGAFNTMPEDTKVTFEDPTKVEVPDNAFKPNSVNTKKTGKVTKLTAGKRTLKVTMKKVSGAKSYRIYYKTTSAKKYKSKLVKPTSKNSTKTTVSYTLKKLSKGKKYKVYYIAYSKASGSKSSAITKTTAKTSPKIK